MGAHIILTENGSINVDVFIVVLILKSAAMTDLEHDAVHTIDIIELETPSTL